MEGGVGVTAARLLAPVSIWAGRGTKRKVFYDQTGNML